MSNFGLNVVVAVNSTPRQFGAFAVAYLTYMGAIGITRAVALEPLLVRAGDLSDHNRREAACGAAGLAAALASGFSVLVFLAALGAGPPLQPVLLVIAGALPLLALQDAARYFLFCKGEFRAAAVLDGAWTGLAFGGFALASVLGQRDAWSFLVIWAASGAATGIAALGIAHALPRLGPTVTWSRATTRLGRALGWDFLLFAGSSQLAIGLLGPIAGLEALAAVRGAGTLLGPLNVILTGARTTLLPAFGKLKSHAPGRLTPNAIRVSLGLALLTAAAGTVLYLLPSSLGERLIGASWDGARKVIPPMTLMVAARAGTEGAWLGLRVIEAGRVLVTARIVAVPFTIGLTVAGAHLGSAAGGMVGLALANCVSLVMFWRGYARSIDQPGFRGGE